MTKPQKSEIPSQSVTAKASHLGMAPTEATAADWWVAWTQEHREQLETYNRMVEKDGLWSDDGRLF
jgi:hypothetical protein